MPEIKSISMSPDIVVRPTNRRRKSASENRAERKAVASVGRFAGDQVHELGNLLIGIVFCLKQLRGCQRTEEQEQVIEQALQAGDQAVEAARALLQATHMLLRVANSEPCRTTTWNPQRVGA